MDTRTCFDAAGLAQGHRPVMFAAVAELRDSKRYAPIRAAFFSSRGKHSQTVVVSSISAVIASTFNIAMGVATSLVAICLLAALQVGVGAYCSYYAEKKVIPPAKKKRSDKKGAKR
jgi:hypothetical protein